MSYKILHRADQEIFRLPEIKNFLRVSHEYDDMWILELVNSSIEAVENFLRFKLLPTKIQVCVDRIFNSKLSLPFSPVAEITGIIIKTSGEEEKLIEQYRLAESSLTICNLPPIEVMTIEYIAGYLDQKAIPAAVKQGILLHVAEMYDSHGANSSISNEVRKLYQPYKKMLV